MSLNIRCPNGCSVALPSSTLGKIVRCPACDATIRIPRKNSGGRLEARWVADAGELGSDAQHQEDPLPSGTFSPSNLIEPPRRTMLEDAEHSSEGKGANPFDFLGSKPEPAAAEIVAMLPIEIERPREVELVEIDVAEEERKDIRKPDAASDRIWLTRFYAVCLFFVGLVNILPVVAFAIYFQAELAERPLPRWGFGLIFLAILFSVYAIFLLQVADWSTLLVVSIFTLIAACGYGFVAAGLMFGNVNGFFANLLQLPDAYYRMGPIWGGIMFCLSALASFVLGKDALAWHRSVSIRRQTI